MRLKLHIQYMFVCCLFDGVQRHFQQNFSYIVEVISIGGGPGENLWWPSWWESATAGHNFGRGPSNDYSIKYAKI
jgi:hypothetical protein